MRQRSDLMPCGTEAASRRHQRHGEPVDEVCRVAANQAQRERRNPDADPYAVVAPEARGPARNGLPVTPPYRYGAPRSAWALQAIARAEAKYGRPPEPAAGFEAA